MFLGALSCAKASIQPHGGRASTEEQTPAAPLFPGWQFLTAGSMEYRSSLSTEEEDRWGLQPDGPSPRSPSPGKAVRSLELTLGLTQNQVYNQLTTLHPHPGHHIQGLVWSH